MFAVHCVDKRNDLSLLWCPAAMDTRQLGTRCQRLVKAMAVNTPDLSGHFCREQADRADRKSPPRFHLHHVRLTAPIPGRIKPEVFGKRATSSQQNSLFAAASRAFSKHSKAATRSQTPVLPIRADAPSQAAPKTAMPNDVFGPCTTPSCLPRPRAQSACINPGVVLRPPRSNASIPWDAPNAMRPQSANVA